MRSKRFLVVCLFLVLSLSQLASVASEDEVPPLQIYRTINLNTKSWRDLAEFNAIVSRISRLGPSNAAHGVFFAKSRSSETPKLYAIRFPPLREGDVVPIYGRFYEVTLAYGQQMEMEWINRSTLPASVHLQPNSFTVPHSSEVLGAFVRIHEEYYL